MALCLSRSASVAAVQPRRAVAAIQALPRARRALCLATATNQVYIFQLPHAAVHALALPCPRCVTAARAALPLQSMLPPITWFKPAAIPCMHAPGA
jgi:hypothetical protein